MNLTKTLRWQYEAHMKEVRDRNTQYDYVRDEVIAIGTEKQLTNLILFQTTPPRWGATS